MNLIYVVLIPSTKSFLVFLELKLSMQEEENKQAILLRFSYKRPS